MLVLSMAVTILTRPATFFIPTQENLHLYASLIYGSDSSYQAFTTTQENLHPYASVIYDSDNSYHACHLL